MKLRCVSTTPLLAPVVPDEYNSAAVSDWRIVGGVNGAGSVMRCEKYVIEVSAETETSSRMTAGRRRGAILGKRAEVVITRHDLESFACFESSCTV